jgi:hypothetical protein
MVTHIQKVPNSRRLSRLVQQQSRAETRHIEECASADFREKQTSSAQASEETKQRHPMRGIHARYQ